MTSRQRIASVVLVASLGLGPGFGSSVWALAQNRVASTENQTVLRLINQGQYWFDLYRFDLANQAFNKVLLIEPDNAEALKWKGLLDVSSSNPTSARLWLDRIQALYGADNPHGVELEQTLRMSTDLRTRISEIQFLSRKSDATEDWSSALKSLFNHKPLGQAAILVYGLLSEASESDRATAQTEVRRLLKQFPNDRRYAKLLADLGGPSNGPADLAMADPRAAQLDKASKQTERPNRGRGKGDAGRSSGPATRTGELARSETEAITESLATESSSSQAPEPPPEPSQFDQARALNEQGLKQISDGQRSEGLALLAQAVEKLPAYAWFRFDLALALLDGGQSEANQADDVMTKGLIEAPEDRDMAFANALYAARRERSTEALILLDRIPRSDWTLGMSNLEGRLSYQMHLDNLSQLEQANDFDQLAVEVAANPRWRAEPEVLGYENLLRNKASTRVEVARRTSDIDGSEGISKFEGSEIAFEAAFNPSYSTEVFVRADRLSTGAGDFRNLEDAGDLTGLGQFGRLSRQELQEAAIRNEVAPDPLFTQAKQESTGFLLGAGLRRENLRIDLGIPTGDLPVKSWVGGLRLDYDLPDGALFRVDIARRMVGGSLLSFAGARDPISGETWGGARRNGLNLLYYTPLSEDRSFVGIGRVNHITGKNTPDNTEVNLQGILSQTLWKNETQSLEVALSTFFWQFERNLRLYTFGQGGYYSPQNFISLSLPVTWTGRKDDWSWQVRASVGQSRSREDDTDLYPGRPDLQALALAAGNPVTDEGDRGGGSSRGLRFSLERALGQHFALGFNAQLDRSEGYNPDFATFYLRTVFPGENSLRTPPESLVPYSQF